MQKQPGDAERTYAHGTVACTAFALSQRGEESRRERRRRNEGGGEAEERRKAIQTPH